jgi:hypothetical protein
MKRTKQTASDKNWFDESGAVIPYNRTTPLERLREKKAFSLYSTASKLNSDLLKFKTEFHEAIEKVLELARKENAVKLDGKGNFTWYNFNRTIKIEVNNYDLIKFDELTIEAAKEKLFTIIRDNIQGDDFIISIVEDAFQTSKGKLDTRKVLGLKKHTSRIKDKTIKDAWIDAMGLIDKAVSRPTSKTYHKVWVKDNDGKYQPIDLNFSSL